MHDPTLSPLRRGARRPSARPGLALALALAGLPAVPALAANANLFSYNGGGQLKNESADDFVSVSRATPLVFGMASGQEFTGGAGVFASASSIGQNMQAQASARRISTFTVSCPLLELDDLVCGLDLSFIVSGQATASGLPSSGNPTIFGTAEAGYIARWSLTTTLANASGGGEVHSYSRDNGQHEETVIGDPFTSHHLVQVVNGSQVTLVLQASAGAFTDNNGDGSASASADFSHTLRWGGVSAVYDPRGNALNLGGLHLMGSDGFDYVHAAPPNPYASAVPEPAAWGLMATGLLVLGCRRRPISAPPSA